MEYFPSNSNESTVNNNSDPVPSEAQIEEIPETSPSTRPVRNVPRINYSESRSYRKKQTTSSSPIIEQAEIPDDSIHSILNCTTDELLKSNESQKWEDAINREIQTLEEKGTWELVEYNPDITTIGSTLVLKVKTNADGKIIQHKARLVAQGFSQVEGLNYSETFAPVINFQTVLLCLSIACFKNWPVHHIDFDSAYLNAPLKETIYMRPPKQLKNDAKFCNKLLLLKKSIYGLKQAGREWNELLTSKLLELNWTQCIHEPCLFTRRINNCVEILLVYVDDLLIIAPNLERMSDCKKELLNLFQIKDLGGVKHFLNISISIDYERKIINLKQPVLLNEFVKDIKGKTKTNIPITKELFNNVSDNAQQNIHLNQSKIGSLLYLSRFTRPEITFTVSFASRYVSFENGNCNSIIEKISRYLFSHQNLELKIDCRNIDTFNCYSDSDFAGDILERYSTSGYTLFLGKGLVSWRSCKQSMIATSTMEAEYIALNVALKEAIGLSYIYDEIIGKKPEIIIYCDNNAVIEIIQNSKYRNKTKHIDVQYHFARKHFNIGTYKLERVESNNNLADIMTKPLDSNHFTNNARKLGLNSQSQVLGGVSNK